MRGKICLILIACAMLGACASQGPATATIDNQAPAPGIDAAQIQLAEAATSVSQSLSELAQIEKATHPAAKLPPPPDARELGMTQIVSVNWTGPIEALVAKIAKLTHYKLHVLGKKPAIPDIVAIHADNMQIAEVLRNAAYQAGYKTDIKVYPAKRIIELRYRNS